MAINRGRSSTFYGPDRQHINRPPSRASVKDAHPERASRVDRPVPTLSGRFRPCWKGPFSGIRPSLYTPLDSSKPFLEHFRTGCVQNVDMRDSILASGNGPILHNFGAI